MVTAVSLLLILIGTTYFVVRAKPKKSKWMITGLVFIFFIAPLLSWIISMTIGIYYGEGFTAAGMLVITFPILVLHLVGLVISFYWLVLIEKFLVFQLVHFVYDHPI